MAVTTVCSFFKGSVTFSFKLPGRSFPARGILPALGVGDQTFKRRTEEEKEKRRRWKLGTDENGGSEPVGCI